MDKSNRKDLMRLIEKNYDRGFQEGYEKGYKRAQLDYGLEDDVMTAHWTNGLGKALKLNTDGVPEVSFNDDGAWCSNCKEKLIGSKVYDTIGRYCPNCGAKMEG